MASPINTGHDFENDHSLHVVVVSTGGTASILLQGEADLASMSQLRDVLDDGGPGNVQVVELHAGGLLFCDVSAMRELASFARRARAQGRTVTTLGAPAIMRKMARLMGVTEDLGIR